MIGALLLPTALALAGSETEDDIRLYIVPSRVEAVAAHVGPYDGLSERFVHAVDWSSRHGWHAMDQGVAVLYSDPTSVRDSQLKSEARVAINVYGRLLMGTRIILPLEPVSFDRMPRARPL